MLVDNKIEIKITRRNVTYYKNLGYDVPKITGNSHSGCDGTILVDSKDVNPKSNVVYLDFVCDCCGKSFKRTPEHYYKRVRDTGDINTYCQKCYHVGASNTMMDRYGYEYGGCIPEAKDKQRQTCLERYGVEYVQQSLEFKQKSRETLMEKYGVEHISQTDWMRERSRQSFHNNGLVSSSSSQRKIAEMVGGSLNYKFHGFYLDVLYEDWLDIEYDGTGHDLRVKCGKMSREDFNLQERKRYAAIHAYGLKTLTIIGGIRDVLPSDDKLLSDINAAIETLRSTDKHSLIIDYSNLR